MLKTSDREIPGSGFEPHSPLLSLSVSQVPAAAGDVVAVSPAASHRGVERGSALHSAGFGRAGVHHLSPPARQRFGERRVPALLL